MRKSSCKSFCHRSKLYEEKIQRLSKRMQNIDKNINKIKMKSRKTEKRISKKKSYIKNTSMIYIDKIKNSSQFNYPNLLIGESTENSDRNRDVYLTNYTKYNREINTHLTNNNSLIKIESQINEIKNLKNKVYRLQNENRNLNTKLYTLKNNNDIKELSLNSKNGKIIKKIMDLYNRYFLGNKNNINEVSLADILMNILKLKYKYENSLLFNEFFNGMNKIMNDYSGNFNKKDEFGIYYLIKDLLQIQSNLFILQKNNYKENEECVLFIKNSMNNLNINSFDEFRNKLNSMIEKNKKDEEKFKIVEQVLLTEKSENDYSNKENKIENGNYNDFFATKIDNFYENKISGNKEKYKDRDINGKEINVNFNICNSKKDHSKVEISKFGNTNSYFFRQRSFKNNF